MGLMGQRFDSSPVVALSLSSSRKAGLHYGAARLENKRYARCPTQCHFWKCHRADSIRRGLERIRDQTYSVEFDWIDFVQSTARFGFFDGHRGVEARCPAL